MRSLVFFVSGIVNMDRALPNSETDFVLDMMVIDRWSGDVGQVMELENGNVLIRWQHPLLRQVCLYGLAAAQEMFVESLVHCSVCFDGIPRVSAHRICIACEQVADC